MTLKNIYNQNLYIIGIFVFLELFLAGSSFLCIPYIGFQLYRMTFLFHGLGSFDRYWKTKFKTIIYSMLIPYSIATLRVLLIDDLAFFYADDFNLDNPSIIEYIIFLIIAPSTIGGFIWSLCMLMYIFGWTMKIFGFFDQSTIRSLIGWDEGSFWLSKDRKRKTFLGNEVIIDY